MWDLFLHCLSATSTIRGLPFRHCGYRTAISTLRWTVSGSMHINDAGNKRRYLGVAPREAPRQDCCQQLLLTPPGEKEVHTATATMGGKCGMLMWQKPNWWMWWQVSLGRGLSNKSSSLYTDTERLFDWRDVSKPYTSTTTVTYIQKC
jgi:hypothetical protein